MRQSVSLRWHSFSSSTRIGLPATLLVLLGRKCNSMQKEPGFLPWAMNDWNCKHHTSHYAWKTGFYSRSLLPASDTSLKHQLHMLLFLLGLLLICIIIRKLLPIPNEQRRFKHVPSRENRWFISLTGRKDWHMLSILYPLLWSYKASSVGKDH